MARRTPRSGHDNRSGRYESLRAVVEKDERERAAEKETWKQYAATVQVSIRAKDKRAAREALKSVRPMLGHGIDYEVAVEVAEGPEQVS